jgi:tetratricopeptide (TPR) repeat protein
MRSSLLPGKNKKSLGSSISIPSAFMNGILQKIYRCILWTLIPILGIGYCLNRAFGGPGQIPEVVVWLLFAAAMLIVLAIQVAFPVAGVIGDWFSRIYMPASSEIPPASYILADLYERQHHWEKALAEFQKIIHYHPEELPAHLGRLRVVINGFGDQESAEKFLHASLRAFQDIGSQDAIRRTWETFQVDGADRQ